MKIAWRREIPQWIIILGAFLLAILTWPSAPDRIPIHWNIHGQVDGYAGKFEGLFLLPFLMLGIYFLTLFVPRIDPARAHYNSFSRAWFAIRVSLQCLFAVLYGFQHLWIRGYSMAVGTVLPLVFGALLVVMGNYMGKIRPNWFVGIRTPWTLSSNTTWVKTHRLGGRLFIAAGFLTIAAGILFNTWAFYVLLAAVVAGTLWTYLYSYFIWRSAPDKTRRGV